MQLIAPTNVKLWISLTSHPGSFLESEGWFKRRRCKGKAKESLYTCYKVIKKVGMRDRIIITTMLEYGGAKHL